MKHFIRIILVTLAVSVNAQSQDPSAANKIEFSCKEDTAAVSKYFPEILKSARNLNQIICDAILVPITDGFPLAEVSAFGVFVKKRVNDVLKHVDVNGDEKNDLNMLQQQLDHFEATLATGYPYPQAMPRFYVNKSASGARDKKYTYFFGGAQDEKQGTLEPTEDKNCRADYSLDTLCSTVLLDLDAAIEPYQFNANTFTAYDTRVKLTALAGDWDSYFDLARTQTFFDITVTTLLERNHFKKDYLVGPPKRQWFVLHPNVVFEFVNDAPEGDKFTPALSIEWAAVNWWRDSIIGIPFGVSLTSLYSDRPEVKSVGHGVTLYFDNKYMLGYANHDGQDGFYASMDLLKMFANKKKQIGRYRDRIKKIVD